jgi:hypothetical protein
MIKLKTKTEFTIPTERGTKQSIVRLIVHNLQIDNNNIKANGYYYYIEIKGEVESVVILSRLGDNSMAQFSKLQYLEENMLPKLNSDSSLKANIMQRLEEITLLQIEQEAKENFGTVASDWEKEE